MGYRERRVELIAKHAAPHLEPGEQIQTGFIVLTSSRIFNKPAATYVVTDRAILVVQAADAAQRFPRDYFFGKPTGVYHDVTLGGEFKVHRQWYPEVIAADEALRGMRE